MLRRCIVWRTRGRINFSTQGHLLLRVSPEIQASRNFHGFSGARPSLHEKTAVILNLLLWFPTHTTQQHIKCIRAMRLKKYNFALKLILPEENRCDPCIFLCRHLDMYNLERSWKQLGELFISWILKGIWHFSWEVARVWRLLLYLKHLMFYQNEICI